MSAESELSERELSSLRAAWAEVAPSEWEISAARRRLAFRRERRRRVRPLATLTALLCTLALAGAAYAAVEHYQRRQDEARDSRAEPDEKPEPRQFARSPGPRRVALPATSAEPAPIAIEEVPPASAAPQRAASAEQPAAKPPVETAWQRAARALEQGDGEGAERALSEIESAADPEARDAARLARAQLGLAKGDVANARPVLEDLAQNGATPLIRRRARAALGR